MTHTPVEKILKLSKTFDNSSKNHWNPMDIENCEETFEKLSMFFWKSLDVPSKFLHVCCQVYRNSSGSFENFSTGAVSKSLTWVLLLKTWLGFEPSFNKAKGNRDLCKRQNCSSARSFELLLSFSFTNYPTQKSVLTPGLTSSRVSIHVQRYPTLLIHASTFFTHGQRSKVLNASVETTSNMDS